MQDIISYTKKTDNKTDKTENKGKTTDNEPENTKTISSEILTENFDTITKAKGGIKKLRELILQLAVQGKLVPQNPSDEPASILLEKIKEEKQNLIKTGKIKKQKSLPPIDKDEVPYDLPNNWVWTRLGELGIWSTGGTPSRRMPEYFGGDINWIKSGDLNDGILHFTDEKITTEGLDNSNAKLLPKGTISVALYGATIGKTSILGINATTNQACANCIPLHNFIYNRYLFYYIIEERKNFIQVGQGGAQPNITNGIMHNWLSPLPPLAEQHRIVERVDSLMKLCDDLESRQDSESENKRLLLLSVLKNLEDAGSEEESKEAWEILSGRFDDLINSAEDIKELRKTVLQLAVQGRLVSQNPDDEPASILLEKIQAEKENLIKEGRIKKQKALPSIDKDEVPYELPEGWVWTRLGILSHTIEYGTSKKATEQNIGIPVLRMNNISDGNVKYNNLKYVSDAIDDLPRLYLNKDDILFNRTNSYELVGKSGIFKKENNSYTFASYLIRVNMPKKQKLPDYINLVLNSKYFRVTQIEPEITQQCGQANFNGTKLKNSAIPLPPLAEQHRIVERVDCLMKLCDELEERVVAREEAAERLLLSVCAGISG